MMFYLIFLIMLIFFISILILLINFMLTFFKKINYEKNLPFECGFNPNSSSNLPFSMPFFMITLMFLIFDVEIMIFIPLIIYMLNLNNLILFFIMSFFIFMLMLMLTIEWFYGYLKWLF